MDDIPYEIAPSTFGWDNTASATSLVIGGTLGDVTTENLNKILVATVGGLSIQDDGTDIVIDVGADVSITETNMTIGETYIDTTEINMGSGSEIIVSLTDLSNIMSGLHASFKEVKVLVASNGWVNNGSKILQLKAEKRAFLCSADYSTSGDDAILTPETIDIVTDVKLEGGFLIKTKKTGCLIIADALPSDVDSNIVGSTTCP